MQVSLVAQNLSRLLREAGIPGKELAERLQVSQQAVSQWTRGQLVPTTERLGQIAEALNVQVDELTRVSPSHVSVPIKRFSLDLSPQAAANERLQQGPVFFLPWELVAVLWPEPDNAAAIEVEDRNLEPAVCPGELLFVDLSWRAITFSDLYLLDFDSLPVFRWCHLVTPGTVNVSDHLMNRDVPVTDLTVLGRVVGRLSAGPIHRDVETGRSWTLSHASRLPNWPSFGAVRDSTSIA
jgi:transcriptional regulator with XRE-family HTH domain